MTTTGRAVEPTEDGFVTVVILSRDRSHWLGQAIECAGRPASPSKARAASGPEPVAGAVSDVCHPARGVGELSRCGALDISRLRLEYAKTHLIPFTLKCPAFGLLVAKDLLTIGMSRGRRR